MEIAISSYALQCRELKTHFRYIFFFFKTNLLGHF